MSYGKTQENRPRSILILGAGNAQIDLIERCREWGMEIHGVSCCHTDPGIALLDHFEQIDILDVDGVESYIRRHRIEHIYSVGSDLAMPTISEAARRTGLNCFISPETAQICCSKQLMRSALRGSPYQVRHVICRRLPDAEGIDFYPVIMKPVDSQGQRGIFLCRSHADVQRYFAQSMAHSRCGALILERYLPGDEVSFSGYMLDGRRIFGMLSDRESFKEYPGGIVKGHRLPSVYSETPAETAILALVDEAVKRLNILNGPVYFQIMIHQDHPYLLEVTPRLDGCHMWRLIRLYTGVDLLDMALRHLVSGTISVPQWFPLVKSARTAFVCRAPDTAFVPEPQIGFPAVSRDYYRAGEPVRRINGHMEKCGYRMYVQKKRIALIGGSGVIGRCFARMYAQDFDLIDVSRSTGTAGDYRRSALARSLMGCDAAVILAAKKSVGEDTDYAVNVRIAEEALHACHAAGVKAVVFLSTRCVYAAAQPPFAEDAPISPINAYGKSKYEAEQRCLALAAQYGIRTCVLRIAQVLSPEDTRTAFHTFLSQAMRGENLCVYGRGCGKRDYIDVRDVCRAIRQALLAPSACGVFNIGSGRPTSIAELAHAAVLAADTGAQVVLHEDMPEDTSVSFLRVDKARSVLGFSAQHALRSSAEDGIRHLRQAAKPRPSAICPDRRSCHDEE